MKYAIIAEGGKQYRVMPGDILEIDRITTKPEDTYTFTDVLLYVDGANRLIGAPRLDQVTITAKVLEHKKLRKVRVAKFKAKARYRRVSGYRASVTRVQVGDISVKNS